MRFFVMIGFVVGLLAGHVQAITLEEAVRIALESSDQATSIRERKVQSMSEARETTAFTLPQVDAVAEYHEMDTNAAPNPIVPYPDRQIAARLEASQVLWAGGRVWNSYDLKQQLEFLAAMQERNQRAALAEQVTNAFHAVQFQQALLNVMSDRVQQRKEELQAATDLFESGMVTSIDVREASLNLNLALGDLRAGESDYRTALVDFNLVLGRSADEGLVTPDGDLERPEALTGKKDKLRSILVNGEQRDVKTAEFQVETAQTNYKLARGDHWPSFFLVGSVESSGEETSELDEYWSVGLRMQWNLYKGGETSSRKASALAKMKSAKAALSQTQKNLGGTLNKLDTEIDRLRQRIEIQEKSVRLSEENYLDARGLYGQGTMTLTRLGDFNLRFAEARFNLIRLYFLENQVDAGISALID